MRIGRLVELEAESEEQLPDLCEKLLANPLIEDYEILPVNGSGTGHYEAGSHPDGPGREAEEPSGI